MEASAGEETSEAETEQEWLAQAVRTVDEQREHRNQTPVYVRRIEHRTLRVERARRRPHGRQSGERASASVGRSASQTPRTQPGSSIRFASAGPV